MSRPRAGWCVRSNVAEECGAESMQIFNQSPRAWRPTNYSDDDFAAFRARMKKSPVKSVFIHAAYLINVASDDAELCRKSLTSLTHALSVGDAIGAAGVIVHPGSGKGQAPGPTFKKLGRAMTAALKATDSTPLLFENTAGAGFTIGRTFEELARVIEVSGGGERLGVCLDSCHPLARRPRSARPQGSPRCSRTASAPSDRAVSARCTSTTPRIRSAQTATATPTWAKVNSPRGGTHVRQRTALRRVGVAKPETPAPTEAAQPPRRLRWWWA